MMFDFMRTIILLAFGTIYMIGESGVSSLSTILVLRNARVYVGSLDGCNILSYIETYINKTLSSCTVLRVSNINLYNSHI